MGFWINFKSKSSLPLFKKIVIALILGQFVTDYFVTRESDLYYHYTYLRFVHPKNIEHCSIHCYMDPEDKCDFFFIDGSYCYLGNFNQVSYVYHLTHTVTTYINKGTKYMIILQEKKKRFFFLFNQPMGPIIYFFDGRSPSRHKQSIFF